MSSASVVLGSNILTGGSGSGVTEVDSNAPLSVINPTTTPTISITQSTTSTDGYLSSTDWNTFNNKQDAGDYITALTGDVIATGPGSVTATITEPAKRYIDFLNGDDSTGTGSIARPWKTIQHACDNISPSINLPYVLYLSGGNNSTDSGTITMPPNVNVTSDYLIQIPVPIIITGGTTNDSVTFTNIIFIENLTWIRNDISEIGVTFNNCQFFNGPTVKQQGSGSLTVSGYNSLFVNMTILSPNFGSFFTSCTFYGTTTFEDVNTIPYYQFMGGYIGGPISFSGGPYVYFSGIQADVPFGYTLTAITTANGTPIFQTDASSIPPTITGSPTLVLTSYCQNESYTPTTSANWASPAPSTVQQALDRISDLLYTLNSNNPIP